MARLGLAVFLTVIVLTSGLVWPHQAYPQASVPTQTIDPFGQEVTLAGKPIVYLAGTTTRKDAFASLVEAFKTVQAYLNQAGLQASGPAMTIYTSSSDTGFDFQAAIPLAEPPKTPPTGNIAVGTSPEGKMLKFVHRGTYASTDMTYEAITNFLDDKNLDANELIIEEYVTDPVITPENDLIINIFIPLLP